MPKSVSRFERPSSPLEMKALLGKARKTVWWALALALGVHISLTRIAGFEAEQKAAKPLTTQFVKRAPRLTKPLELKKRPQPKRRRVQRTMVAVKARAHGDTGSTGFQPEGVLTQFASPTASIGRITGLVAPKAEPTAIAEAIRSTKEAEQKIDMALEPLGMVAPNTGKYHALVVQDPDDKRSLQGFCRLSCLYIPRLHDRALPHMGGRGPGPGDAKDLWACSHRSAAGGPVRSGKPGCRTWLRPEMLGSNVQPRAGFARTDGPPSRVGDGCGDEDSPGGYIRKPGVDAHVGALDRSRLPTDPVARRGGSGRLGGPAASRGR